MGAGTSLQSGGAGASDLDSEPPPKKVFLKVKIVGARGLCGPAREAGLLCSCTMPGRRTDFQTPAASPSAEPEWRHLSDVIEDYAAGDNLVFELHDAKRRGRAAAGQDPAGAAAPLCAAALAGEQFHHTGFTGELPLRGELAGEEVRLRVKVVAGTRRAVRDHATRSQVLAEALKMIDGIGLDHVQELDRELYITENKLLAKELRQALKAEPYKEMKQAYADFRSCVEEARSQSSASSAPAVPTVVEARAEALFRHFAPAAGAVGLQGAASLLQRFVLLLPEEPQRHALHLALRSLQKDEELTCTAAQALLEAGEQAAAAEEAAAAAATAAADNEAAAAAMVAAAAQSTAADAARGEASASAAGAAATPVAEEVRVPPQPSPHGVRTSLIVAALRELEGSKLDEANLWPPPEKSRRAKAFSTRVQAMFSPERHQTFQAQYAAFEESVRTRPEEPPEEAELRYSTSAATFAAQAAGLFSEASESVGEDAAAPLLGQMVQLVQEQPVRHALHRELAKIANPPTEEAGASQDQAPHGGAAAAEPGPGALAAVGAALAGTGAAVAAWWSSSFQQAPPPAEQASSPTDKPAAEALLPAPSPTELAQAQRRFTGNPRCAWCGTRACTRRCMNRSQASSLQQGDPGRLQVAQALGSLGSAYRNMGKLQDALRQNQQALQIRQETLGEEHPDTATSHSNVAAIYRLQGKLPDAYEHHTKALEIRRRTLGDLSPETAQSHGNVGAVLLQRGAVDEALEHYLRALEITRAVFGDLHPETAARYNDVGATLEQKGELEKALEHLWNALEIQTQTLGDADPGVGDSYNNVGAVLWQLNRMEEALEFHVRALEIRVATLGENHSDTALSYGNVGVILEQQGRLAEAVEHQRKALFIRSAVLGEQHSETAASHVNVAIALERQGQYSAALDHFRDASRILKTSMGANHPWTKQAGLHMRRCEQASRSAR